MRRSSSRHSAPAGLDEVLRRVDTRLRRGGKLNEKQAGEGAMIFKLTVRKSSLQPVSVRSLGCIVTTYVLMYAYLVCN